MKWRGFLILPIFISIILIFLGLNEFFRLSDPLDFLSITLGVILCIIQVAIWISRLRRSREA
jgi:hypothetical protein